MASGVHMRVQTRGKHFVTIAIAIVVLGLPIRASWSIR